LKLPEPSITDRRMSRVTLGRSMAKVTVVVALAASGCAARSVTPHDATALAAPGAAGPGVAESQPDAPALGPTGDNGGSRPERDPHRTRRLVGWISLTIGVESAVIAVATSIMIEHAKGTRDGDCNAQKICGTDGFNAVGTINTLTPWNTASWFVAAAGLGAGAVLLIISPRESEQRTAITVSPTPGGLGFGLRSTF
jgi:hypothetical protein